MSVKKLLLLVPSWVLGIWGSLQLHTVDLHLGHSICGPWGCGPPLEALLGYHTFWTLLLAPAVMAAVWFAPANMLKRVGWMTWVTGMLLTLAIAGNESYRLWVSSQQATYLGHKFFFAIATKVDFPMLQIVVAGLCLLIAGRSKLSKTMEAVPAEGSPFQVAAES